MILLYTILSLFFLDFVTFAIFDTWITNFLAIYLIHLHFGQSNRINSIGLYLIPYIAIFLLLLQDFYMYGRFGLGLLYIIPISGIIGVIRSNFHSYWFSYSFIFLSSTFICFEFFLIKKLIFGQVFTWESLFTRIFVNLIISLIFIGARGNRFLS